MDQICQESSASDSEQENAIEILNLEIQDGRRPLFWKTLKLNNFETVCLIVTKF